MSSKSKKSDRRANSKWRRKMPWPPPLKEEARYFVENCGGKDGVAVGNVVGGEGS